MVEAYLEKSPREIRWRKETPKKKVNHAGGVKQGRHPQRSMPYMMTQIHLGQHIRHSSRFAHRWWRLVPFMGQAVTDGFPLRHRWAEKKGIVWNPVKAPLGHKRKRNGPCVICLKRYSFVQAWRKALFSAYAGSRNTFVRNSFSGDGVPTYQSAFTEKLMSVLRNVSRKSSQDIERKQIIRNFE